MVGTVLLLTVMATVLFMRIFAIEMERISLGALIIAMGMLVDNAIVVAEGMMINMQRGQKAIEAASRVVAQTMWPLLGQLSSASWHFPASACRRMLPVSFCSRCLP